MVERGELDRGRAELPGLTRSPLLDTPDPALNRAFAWAVRRDPAGVRADPGGEPGWGEDDFDELLEAAEWFRRVGPAADLSPAGFLRSVVAGLFGVRADAAGGRFEIAPWVPEQWRTMALRRLRCHRTLLDVELRARTEWLTLRFELSFGPAIPLVAGLRNIGPVAQITVDEEPLQGDRAIFTLHDEHEVTFFVQAGS